MCGITATVYLPGQTQRPCTCYTNSHDDGKAKDYTDRDVKENLEVANGHLNDVDSHAQGASNVSKNDATTHTYTHTKAYANGYAEGYTQGYADKTSDNKSLAVQLQASIDSINHRGPDESGVWISADGRVGLGHCRLSINDLSPSGHQPLHSDCGELHAVVNGEIYDHDRLRAECTSKHGYIFGGESDSELVIALYKIYGAPALFEHLRGEFAFVLYDGREGCRRVIAGRDRFGIKPLVWTIVKSRLLLAAEAKAFLPLGWQPEWDVGAVVDSGWMMDDRTLFKGVHKLLPGCWMEVTDDRGIEKHRYWDAEYEDKVRRVALHS
jgi:asparagine synthase (glutamine-hydrolysing)